MAQALEQSSPHDVNALIARAQVAIAHRDVPGFTKRLETLRPNLAPGMDESIPWDRRVSLAYVLAQGKQADAARKQVQRCLEELDETNLRFLTTVSLYRLLVMIKRFDLQIERPELRDLARSLVPAEMREHL